MIADLSFDESEFVAYLTKRGLAPVSARALAVIVCRQYCLSKDELVMALEYHFTEKHQKVLPNALDDLLERGLLSVVHSEGEQFLESTEPWDRALLGEAPRTPEDTDLVKRISDFRKRRELELIGRVGWAGRVESRQAFREAIGQARRRIRLGVYSSKTVFPEVADTIKEAIIENAEMHVQVLMLSPRLASEVENNPNLANDVIVGTKKWRELFIEAANEASKKGHKPKLEVHWLEDKDLIAFTRGLLIDDRRWILNIHHPGFERGIDSLVYQGFCIERCTNIFILLDHYWNIAWKHSINPYATFRERVHRAIVTHQNTILGVLIGLLSVPLMMWKQDTWAHWAQGAAVTKIAQDWKMYIEDLGRFLEQMGQSLQDLVRKWRKSDDAVKS